MTTLDLLFLETGGFFTRKKEIKKNHQCRHYAEQSIRQKNNTHRYGCFFCIGGANGFSSSQR